MVDRRFWIMFFIVLSLGFIGLKLWHVQETVQDLQHEQVSESSNSVTYEEIDLVMPVQAFLNRCYYSPSLSVVKGVFVSKWIYSNQQDLVKLVVYAQGSTTFNELKKALQHAIEKEGPTNNACYMVEESLKIIENDPKIIAHVNRSLVQGFSPKIHELRGRIMAVDHGSKEYRKLKTEYRKALDAWVNDVHGSLLDEIIAHI